MSRELLARAWAAGAGPGASPLTIGLDSTICEAYGLAKEGGTRFTHTGVRGYHPLLAVAAGTGDVLMARLRGGSGTSNFDHGIESGFAERLYLLDYSGAALTIEIVDASGGSHLDAYSQIVKFMKFAT